MSEYVTIKSHSSGKKTLGKKLWLNVGLCYIDLKFSKHTNSILFTYSYYDLLSSYFSFSERIFVLLGSLQHGYFNFFLISVRKVPGWPDDPSLAELHTEENAPGRGCSQCGCGQWSRNTSLSHTGLITRSFLFTFSKVNDLLMHRDVCPFAANFCYT